MKIRILSIACVTTAAALLAACTAVYKNSDACEQTMRSKLAETSPDTLKISHTGAGIDGSRVVVEGSIEHVVTAAEAASEAAATAAAAAQASAVLAASATNVASARSAAASGASGTKSAFGASVAAAASGASAVQGASSVAATSARSTKSTKPKTTTEAAAGECTFHGRSLAVFNWLAPAKLATPPVDTAASAAAQ